MDLSIDFYNEHKIWYKYLELLAYFCRLEFLNLFYYLFLIPKHHYKHEIDKIISIRANVICFSVNKYNISISLYIARKIKEINPNIKIIFGGPACHYKDAKSFISKSKSVDYIVDSEGDILLLEILKKIKDKNHIIKNTVLTDINQEPLPDFSGFDLGKYSIEVLPYSTTRGCYKRCEYCFDIVFWKRYRQKSAIKIFNDLKQLKDKYGIDVFIFSDSVIIGSMKNIEELCDLIMKHKLKIKWCGQIRAQGLDEKILKKMKDAGCVTISIGVESGSQRILNIMNKDSSIEEMQRAIRAASKVGIKIQTLFMVGYPTETWKDFYKTIKFVRDNSKHIFHAFYTPTSILEGTVLYNTAEKFGIHRKNSIFWFSKNSSILTRFTKLFIIRLIDKIYISKKTWD